jgi:hypothetical protein
MRFGPFLKVAQFLGVVPHDQRVLLEVVNVSEGHRVGG